MAKVVSVETMRESDAYTMYYTVDADTLRIREIRSPGTDTVEWVLPGAECPLKDELDQAFADSRTVLVHFPEAGDMTYSVPGSWAFHVGDSWEDDPVCFSDAAMTTEISAMLPADGKDYEVWVGAEGAYGGTTGWQTGGEPEAPEEPESPAVPASLSDCAGEWMEQGGVSSVTILPDGRMTLRYGENVYTGTIGGGQTGNGTSFSVTTADGASLEGSVRLENGALTVETGADTLSFSLRSPIAAFFAEDISVPDGANEFQAYTGEYGRDVLLTAAVPVKNFSFYSLKMEAGPEDEPVYSVTELYRLADMNPEKPLLVRIGFGEFYPMYGFSWRDETGINHAFGLTQSGMDGSLVLTEISIAFG